MNVAVPTDLLEALGEHTGHFWSDPLMEPIIWDAIRALMNPAPAAPQQPAVPSEAGYQWKQVFLPEGTKLRASFGRQPYFAVVEGAEIKCGEQSMSPSGFANLYGSGNRNAWKAIWLRLPGSDAWLLADVFRSARNKAIARMFGDDAPAVAEKSRATLRPRPVEDEDKDEDEGMAPASRRTSDRAIDRAFDRIIDRIIDRGVDRRIDRRIDAGERALIAGKAAARPSQPHHEEVRPHAVPKAAHGDDVPRKKRSGRGGGRKRHAAKHGQ
ncbi:hypothetical protein [Rugamonas sp.]|uniref:hypothetical protein n=1 Tax=Rugamonas sp. TaxID=1926287 RepID=UPI0025D04F87|nr:hypothetical protein [Rugamonas sp.]